MLLPPVPQQGGITVREVPGEAAGRPRKTSASSFHSFFGFLVFLVRRQGTWPPLHFVTGRRKRSNSSAAQQPQLQLMKTELGQPAEPQPRPNSVTPSSKAGCPGSLSGTDGMRDAQPVPLPHLHIPVSTSHVQNLTVCPTVSSAASQITSRIRQYVLGDAAGAQLLGRVQLTRTQQGRAVGVLPANWSPQLAQRGVCTLTSGVTLIFMSPLRRCFQI